MTGARVLPWSGRQPDPYPDWSAASGWQDQADKNDRVPRKRELRPRWTGQGIITLKNRIAWVQCSPVQRVGTELRRLVASRVTDKMVSNPLASRYEGVGSGAFRLSCCLTMLTAIVP